MKRWFLLCALFFVLGAPALAKTEHIEGTVKSVLENIKIVMVQTSHGERKVSVLNKATVDGREGTVKDIKVGDHISVDGVVLNNGNIIATRVISYGGHTNYQFNQTLSMQPHPNSSTSNTRPQLVASFPFNPNQYQFWLDGARMTNGVRLSGNTVSLTPPYDLTAGNHRVMVMASGNGGQQTANWTFNVTHGGTQNWPNAHSDQLMPSPNSTAPSRRPTIGAIFPESVHHVSLVIDGRNFNNQVSIWGSRASWTPTYDLDTREHHVAISAVGQSGRHYSDTWSFNVPGDQATAAAVKSYSPKPGEILTVFRPTISCNFADSIKRTKVTMTVDGHDVTASANIGTGSVSWTPNYNLDYGQHIVRIDISDRNGHVTKAHWTFTIGR